MVMAMAMATTTAILITEDIIMANRFQEFQSLIFEKLLKTGEKYGLKTKNKTARAPQKIQNCGPFLYILSVWVRILIPGG